MHRRLAALLSRPLSGLTLIGDVGVPVYQTFRLTDTDSELQFDSNLREWITDSTSEIFKATPDRSLFIPSVRKIKPTTSDLLKASWQDLCLNY